VAIDHARHECVGCRGLLAQRSRQPQLGLLAILRPPVESERKRSRRRFERLAAEPGLAQQHTDRTGCNFAAAVVVGAGEADDLTTIRVGIGQHARELRFEEDEISPQRDAGLGRLQQSARSADIRD
jgi:hypothetical protein